MGQNHGMGLGGGDAAATVIQFDGPSATSRGQPRTLPTSPLLLSRDADDDKYRRRSTISSLSRWWRSFIGKLIILPFDTYVVARLNFLKDPFFVSQ